jgi:hypothetical protein
VLGRNCRFLQKDPTGRGPPADPTALAQLRAGIAAHQAVTVRTA